MPKTPSSNLPAKGKKDRTRASSKKTARATLVPDLQEHDDPSSTPEQEVETGDEGADDMDLSVNRDEQSGEETLSIPEDDTVEIPPPEAPRTTKPKAGKKRNSIQADSNTDT